MSDLYISMFSVIIVAAVAAAMLRERPQRILIIAIAANVAFSIDAVHFVSWLAIFPCLIVIAFIIVIISHPQIKLGKTPEE